MIKQMVRFFSMTTVLLLTSCSSLSFINYRLPFYFQLSVQRSLPVQITQWRADVLQADVHRVYEHCHWGTSGGCIRYPDKPNRTHTQMVEELAFALKDAFSLVPILDKSPGHPKIRMNAAFRALSADEILFWGKAHAVIRYQFIYEDKVFYETEIRTTDTVFDISPFFESSRKHDALNQAVSGNIAGLLIHLNQPENQTAFFKLKP